MSTTTSPRPWSEMTGGDIRRDVPENDESLYRQITAAMATFDEDTRAHLAETIRDGHQRLLSATQFERAALWADLRATLLGLPLPSCIPGITPPKRWADITAQELYDDSPHEEGSLYLIIREHWYRIDALTREALRPKIYAAIGALREDDHLGEIALWESLVEGRTRTSRRGRPVADRSSYPLDQAVKDAKEHLELSPPKPPRIVTARKLVEGVEELQARWDAVIGLIEHHGGTVVEEAPGRWVWRFQDAEGEAATAAEAVTAALSVAFLV